MRVRDVMTKDPITIDPEAPIGTALAVMREQRVRHLPVVDDDSQLMGIITDRDLRHAAFGPALTEYLSARARRRAEALSARLDDVRVRDVMTWGVATTHPAAPLAHAALVMSERRVGSLPVIEQGRLVGMLTERDVLRALTRDEQIRTFDAEGFLW